MLKMWETKLVVWKEGGVRLECKLDGDWVFEQLSLTHLNVASILGLAIHTHRQARTHTHT